jgi:hypothetical protein
LQTRRKVDERSWDSWIHRFSPLSPGIILSTFSAPEVLQTLDGIKDGYSFEVDMYSIGVILYILYVHDVF